ncbi:pyridoxamine 5'-phosphate oxidase family protein [Aminipila terrae]|uniref:Pyridoxamine 5'-phosphate oxidase family protein n=1 Tax=Aminipila terrae TaxID=2697030 RepID=A0A6P1M8I7_9FIRM|nr:pyridoxamine 5'-phosphate oxidase family protein [Aminipila terrae]QHI71039.1 pyridoxamine 5'-phosphate oxidase family protein [Aminipila terrae]
MNVEKEFYRMMATQTEIALATCIASVPNVRIVNFIFDEEKKLIYFSTFGDNEKVKEFETNNEIAFTTIPHMGNEHVRARGVVRKSERTIFHLAEVFSKKITGYADTIEQVGEYLVLYEISFTSANVILNFESADVIEL